MQDSAVALTFNRAPSCEYLCSCHVSGSCYALRRAISYLQLLCAQIWASAHGLAELLEKRPDLVRGRRVLELGSGCGLAGILAAKLGAAQVHSWRDQHSTAIHAVDSIACNGHVRDPSARNRNTGILQYHSALSMNFESYWKLLLHAVHMAYPLFAGLQVTLTDRVPAVLRTLAASAALNLDAPIKPLHGHGTEQAQVTALVLDITRFPTVVCSRRGCGSCRNAQAWAVMRHCTSCIITASSLSHEPMGVLRRVKQHAVLVTCRPTRILSCGTQKMQTTAMTMQICFRRRCQKNVALRMVLGACGSQSQSQPSGGTRYILAGLWQREPAFSPPAADTTALLPRIEARTTLNRCTQSHVA